MTSVLIIDDHPMIVKGCRAVLSALDVQAISEATTADGGYETYLRERPDVVIVDLAFEGDDLAGLALIDRIKKANDGAARILVFSMHDNPIIMTRALAQGALSYVLKDMPSSELSVAFDKVRRGEPYLNHQLATLIALVKMKSDDSPIRDLTQRELVVLRCVSQGENYAQIADRLGLSYKSITNVCYALRNKLHIDNHAGLIRFGLRHQAKIEVATYGLAGL